jgi:hypothetical protein
MARDGQTSNFLCQEQAMGLKDVYPVLGTCSAQNQNPGR